MDSPLSQMDYGQLRAFAAVAETLSFSRAAESLGVTPSALSQTIRGLEEGVGIQLLHRTTRRVSLTSAGESLFRRVKPAIFELGAALLQAGAARGRPAGTVRVHAFRSASGRYVEPILADFLGAHPDIVLDLTVDDEAVDVVGGRFDVSIRIGEVIEQDMIAVRLGPELRQIAVASPDYLAAHGAPAEPRALLHHACIRWRWPGLQRPYDWEFCENGKWFDVRVEGPLIVNDKALAVKAAVSGIGIALCVEDAVEEDLRAGRLVALLEAWSDPFPGFFLCYPRQRQMAPALRAFIDAIRAAA